MKLSEKFADIKPSATLAITARAKELSSRGIKVINFAAGEPDFNSPLHVRKAAIRAINSGFTKYTPVSGTKELKEAIRDKFKNDNRLDYKIEQLVVSCGAKHSLFNILQVLSEQGDEVIIPSPYWVSYPQMVKLAGAKPIIVRTELKDQFKLGKAKLADFITARTKAIILNNPANPTGSVYTQPELVEIAKLAVRHNICIISDEIYEKIIYDNVRHISIASLNREINRLTIVVNGVSKAYSMTGWRIGYMAGPPALASAVTILQSHSTSNPSSIAQKAALAALRGGGRFTIKIQKEFNRRRNYILKELQKIDKISFFRPQGAFYLFCNVSELGMDSLSFTRRLLDQEKVALVPGIVFGEDDYVRISFATGMEDIKEGIKRLKRFIGS
jgi:aspartate aminotransferase